MEYTHVTTVYSFLQAIIAGFAIGIYYDLFRLLRRLIKCKKNWVDIQDIFFWISSAVCLFFICISLNNGFIRIYFILSALIGWGIYYSIIGRFLFGIIDWLLKILRKLIARIKNFILHYSTKSTQQTDKIVDNNY